MSLCGQSVFSSQPTDQEKLLYCKPPTRMWFLLHLNGKKKSKTLGESQVSLVNVTTLIYFWKYIDHLNLIVVYQIKFIVLHVDYLPLLLERRQDAPLVQSIDWGPPSRDRRSTSISVRSSAQPSITVEYDMLVIERVVLSGVSVLLYATQLFSSSLLHPFWLTCSI